MASQAARHPESAAVCRRYPERIIGAAPRRRRRPLRRRVRMPSRIPAQA
jgi:hypothetical protein